MAVTSDGVLVAVWEQDVGSGEIEHRRFQLELAPRGDEDAAIAIPVSAAVRALSEENPLARRGDSPTL